MRRSEGGRRAFYRKSEDASEWRGSDVEETATSPPGRRNHGTTERSSCTDGKISS